MNLARLARLHVVARLFLFARGRPAPAAFLEYRELGDDGFMQDAHLRPKGLACLFVTGADLRAERVARLFIARANFMAERRKLIAHLISKLHDLRFHPFDPDRQFFEHRHPRDDDSVVREGRSSSGLPVPIGGSM